MTILPGLTTFIARTMSAGPAPVARFIRPTSTLGGDPSVQAAASTDRSDLIGAVDEIAITSAPASSALGLQAQRQRLPVYKQRRSEIEYHSHKTSYISN